MTGHMKEMNINDSIFGQSPEQISIGGKP